MQIYNQSVFEKWPIEDNSIQVIVTSPPYYSLRKYSIPNVIIGGDRGCTHGWKECERKPIGGKGTNANVGANKLVEANLRDGSYFSNFCIHCHAWQGQYGLEPDYKLYVAHCKLWMQEAIRVLRDDGIIFVNLGDSYSTQSGGMAQGKYGKLGISLEDGVGIIKQHKQNYPLKSKLLIPERFAIVCVDELGLILRNHICWSKPNAMPESVTDRFSKKWESIFMFVKQPKYYFDLDTIREPQAQVSIDRLQRAVSNNNKWVMGADGQTRHGLSQPRPNVKSLARDEAEIDNQIGKNPSDVWNIPTQPSPEKHFAMWPEKLVERMILCSTKIDDTVLDPFCGSGTTGKVALQNNRRFIGIDLGYSDIQKRRMSNIQKKLRL